MLDDAPGSCRMREGDPSDAMYVLVSGRLRVTTASPDDGRRHVGEVAPGEVVGELGLLSGEPRAATVEAIRATSVVRMGVDVFQQLAERYPEAVMRLARLITARQQRALRARPVTSTRALVVTLVPICPDVPVTARSSALGFGSPEGWLWAKARPFEPTTIAAQ